MNPNRKRWLMALLGAVTLAAIMSFQQPTATAQDAEEAPAAETAAPAEEVAPVTDAAAPAEAAEEAPAEEEIAYLTMETANIIWLLLAGFLVFFMQAGFAMVETGLTRAKSACNIMMKNLMDFCMGCLLYWAIGYCFMYGGNGNAIIGWDTSLLFLAKADRGTDYALSAAWFFQLVFAATAATIVSGAMAERTKLIAYLIYSAVITAIIYPISGHWIWGGGWLSAMGFRDFAGSTVVHSVGAWCALMGAIMIGPRLGKYGPDGTGRAIQGHNLPLAALGVFILFFGWFGFNPGSTLLMINGVSHVAVTTALAAAAGANTAMFTSWIMFKKPDVSMALNGTLAGLVGITAPCASVSGISAVVIGAIAGIIVVFSVVIIDNKFKIDDPVGAISVHGVCGAWGTLAVGLFGDRSIDLPYWSEESAIKSNGLFIDGSTTQLGIQAVGVLAVFVYTCVLAFILFAVIKATVGLRISAEEESMGIDIAEHGNEAYPDFVPQQHM